jgi:hypothetical protein
MILQVLKLLVIIGIMDESFKCNVDNFLKWEKNI